MLWRSWGGLPNVVIGQANWRNSCDSLEWRPLTAGKDCGTLLRPPFGDLHRLSYLVAVAAWIRRGELEAARIATAEYSDDSFKQYECFDHIRELDHNFANVITSECASAGVCVGVLYPNFLALVFGALLGGFLRHDR